MLVRDWFSAFILTLFALLFFYLLASPINLATADLGRHIRNGEQLLSGNFDLLYTNFYSYTYPEFPFVNHHWLGGVIFYITGLFGSFYGIHLLFIIVSLSAFLIFFTISKKYSNIAVSSIIALLIIPVIAYRYEIRPEVFSYLFAGIYYLILKRFLEGKLKMKWLFSLVLLQLIWVNTHIYFFIGFLVLGAFWIEAVVRGVLRRERGVIGGIREMTILGGGLGLVSLLNPHGLNGLIYPFQILGNYGYRVLENQSIFFLENIIEVPAVLYFKITLTILIMSWVYAIYRFFRYKQELSIANLVLSIGLSYLALTQVRNFAIFGFFALIIISINLRALKLDMNKYFLFPALGVLVIFILVINPKYWEARVFGLGLAPEIEKGAEFFVKENIKGPVFNNYDIGGYLIYYLFPEEKVFVDNRPEGYPVQFFTETYVPMQESDELWEAKLKEYNFNSIFFYRQDLTPWAQHFLLSRIKDPNWAAVFVDNYNIIFLKRDEQNNELIKKYELPKKMFRTGDGKD